MGLPDQANAKPVSSLRAFFEQQGTGGNASPFGGKVESAPTSGSLVRNKVKSNFIPVPSLTAFSSPQKVELSPNVIAPGITVEQTWKERGAPGIAAEIKAEISHEIKQSQEIAEPLPRKAVAAKRDIQETIPKVTEINGSDRENSIIGTKNGSVKASERHVEIERAPKLLETALPPPESRISKVASPADKPEVPSTPKSTAPPASPKVTPTSKKPAGRSLNAKSPPATPKRSPETVKQSPKQTKAAGPLSPTMSISSRRSSSPFIVSPTRISSSNPQKERPNTTKTATKSNESPRKDVTPKSVASTTKPSPRTIVTPSTKSSVKVYSSPANVTTPSSSTLSIASVHNPVRPRSALSNTNMPSRSRRTVSQPSRPSTSSSNKPSPRLNRSASLRSLPKMKVTPSDLPPVPPIPRVVRTSGSDQDENHLPAFMRPTQASSAKVIARPVSVMEKRSRGDSFKV